MIDKVIIVGGEPLDQPIESLRHLLRGIKQHKPNLDIYLFTHYELDKVPNNIKFYTDYIKTGEYIPELKCEDNIQYGILLATKNQNIYKKELDY